MARIGIVARVLPPLSAALVKAVNRETLQKSQIPVEVIAHCAPRFLRVYRAEFGREESTTATAAKREKKRSAAEGAKDEHGRSNRRKSFAVGVFGIVCRRKLQN